MNVLDDDRFRIGFEYEFIALDFQSLFGKKKLIPIKICALDCDSFCQAFNLPFDSSCWLRSMLEYNAHNRVGNRRVLNRDKRYISDEDYAMEQNIGIPRLISFLKLHPRHGKWFTYSRSKKQFLDVTDRVQSVISGIDSKNLEQIEETARKLSHYFVLITEPSNKKSYYDYSDINAGGRKLAKGFTEVIGKEVKWLTYRSERLTKTKPDWYLRDEGIDVPFDGVDQGIELTTPLATPKQALRWCEEIPEAIFSRKLPVKTLVDPNCGIHINISHPDVKFSNASRIWFALCHNENNIKAAFGREYSYFCSSLFPILVETVRSLIDKNVISLSAFCNDSTRDLVVRMIESSLYDHRSETLSFSYMRRYGYAEYRMAGGAKYKDQVKETKKLLKVLLKSHWESAFPSKSLHSKLYRMLKEVGAEKNNGKSLIETIPDGILDRRKQR